MDFNSLREQILANIDKYNPQDMKVVITKLLDFLVDINEKRSKLEKENKQLFEDISNKNSSTEDVSSNPYKDKMDDLFVKAKEESKKIIEKANIERDQILTNARNQSHQIIEEAESKKQELILTSIDQIESMLANFQKIDDERKLYRSHILSIFRRTIFRFADSNYYIFRSDNKDFRELLHFLEVDEKLQKFCDDNMAQLEENEQYKKLLEEINHNPEIKDINEITSILNEKQITINNEQIDIESVIQEIEVEEEPITPSESFEEEIEEPSQNQKTFMDIMNKYKKK